MKNEEILQIYFCPETQQILEKERKKSKIAKEMREKRISKKCKRFLSEIMKKWRRVLNKAPYQELYIRNFFGICLLIFRFYDGTKSHEKHILTFQPYTHEFLFYIQNNLENNYSVGGDDKFISIIIHKKMILCI